MATWSLFSTNYVCSWLMLVADFRDINGCWMEGKHRLGSDKNVETSSDIKEIRGMNMG